MGFRARKSFKIAPGVRMTVTPRGVGMSAGVRGARVSAHSSGRVTQTVGIPGSGMSYSQTVRSPSKAAKRGGTGRASSGGPPVASPAASRQSKPGIFAPGWEKVLYKAVVKDDKPVFARVAESEPRARHTALFLDAVAGPNAGKPDLTRDAIEVLWQEGYDPSSDRFLKKYVPSDVMELGIAEGVTATIAVDRDAIGLLLGEVRQALGDISGAIDVVEQVTPSTVAAVSLAELYAAQERWDDVVNLTNGVPNEDAFATFLLIQRGVALREQQHYDASREALKAALAPRSRPATLRHMALIERGQTYLAEGKKAMARKDFEKVLAEDATYPGLAEHLAALGQ